jgi:DNA-binding transcriptional ArsR family regulator
MPDRSPPQPTPDELLALLPSDYLFRAFGHPVRLRVLVETERRPLSAGEIGELVGLSNQAMQWHIGKLAEVSLIRAVGGRRRRAFTERLWRASYPGWGKLAALIDSISAEGKAARKAERIVQARARERAILRAARAPARASGGRSSRRGGGTQKKS